MATVTATVTISIAVLTDLITNQCASSRTANSPERRAEDSITKQAASHSANACTYLGIARMMRAATQCQSATQHCGNQKRASKFNHLHLLACCKSNVGELCQFYAAALMNALQSYGRHCKYLLQRFAACCVRSPNV